MYKLRELERKDISEINKWRNNPELIENLGAPFRFINEDVDNNWFDNYMKNRNSCVRCAITSDDNDLILGLITLASIDNLNQSAELHLMIGDKKNQGKGIGTYALQQMVKHAFYNLNIHRIELTVLEDNSRAQALYKKIGFVQEGIKRAAKFKNGKFKNMLIFSLLREDFHM